MQSIFMPENGYPPPTSEEGACPDIRRVRNSGRSDADNRVENLRQEAVRPRESDDRSQAHPVEELPVSVALIQRSVAKRDRIL